jgi:hypothetical protein
MVTAPGGARPSKTATMEVRDVRHGYRETIGGFRLGLLVFAVLAQRSKYRNILDLEKTIPNRSNIRMYPEDPCGHTK